MDRAKLEENFLIRDEILTMRQLCHPNILSFHSSFVNNFEVFVVAPLMCFCSCRDAMNNLFTTGFPEHIVCLILKDVLLGLDYLHKKGFIHRSIRASHILLNRNKAVLCGFRECSCLVSHGERVATLHNLPPSSVKSLNWLAPEVLEQNLLGYTEQSDIYSLGIATCELANGLEPFSDMATTFMLVEKIRGHQPALLDCSTCPPPTGGDSGVGDSIAETRQIYGMRKFSDNFHNFAEICMQRHPIDRPTVAQLQNHAFFKQIKHMTLFEQLLASGIETLDCTKINDENIGLSCDFGDMNIDGTFEWDF